jgi:tRNA wybutosine-synthesizing protein 3
MNSPNLLPLTTNTPPLASFPTLRSRNLATLYEIGTDKSPKGFIDAKIAPLCNLINHHDEYVTTSSCSGRVALFDPGVSNDSNDESSDVEWEGAVKKSTKLSGKGRGQWRFVTHDVLPDLGSQLVAALEEAVKERNDGKETSTYMLTLKYEPPLLHIAAASLHAGQNMLRIFKSVCRESGLMVTGERVTVEVRTMGTALCIPIFINADSSSGECRCQPSPSKDYLMNLANIMNDRMVQNEALLGRLYNAVKSELFQEATSYREYTYEVQIQSLPSLNLWKSAAVVLSSGGSQCEDVDVVSFGGQGIGPNDNTTCQRWDRVFRLKRRQGAWSKSWDGVKLLAPHDESLIVNIQNNVLRTNAGSYHVEVVISLGRREGHAACILNPLISSQSQTNVVVIFGGRTGGPLSPTNDIFLFVLQGSGGQADSNGIMCKPCDVRGSPPSARFGHTMTLLQDCNHCKQFHEGEPLALIAGGTGIGNDGSNQTLPSAYILSRLKDNVSDVHHLLWERISDMQVPRAYHTAFGVSVESCRNSVLVFGGLPQSDDPFGFGDGSLPSSEVLSSEINSCSAHTKRFLPSLVGGAGSVLTNHSSATTFLVSGGVDVHDQTSNVDKQQTIQIFRLASNDNIIDRIRTEVKVISNCSDQTHFDLGVLTHHCLVSLPTSSNVANDSGDVASIISIGGGVSSFSFGQSYAK